MRVKPENVGNLHSGGEYNGPTKTRFQNQELSWKKNQKSFNDFNNH